MVGTRNFISHHEDVKSSLNHIADNSDINSTSSYFILRLYQQAKQISQIISYIWRWIDADPKKDPKGGEEFTPEYEYVQAQKEAANKLKDYFLNPTSAAARHLRSGQGDRLKRLFKAHPKSHLNATAEYYEEACLLNAVFDIDKLQGEGHLQEDGGQYFFPIFDELELAEHKDLEHLGYIFEVDMNNFQGRIDDADRNLPDLFTFRIPYPPRPSLGGQLNQQDLDDWIKNRSPRKYFSDNPYIPTTCS